MVGIGVRAGLMAAVACALLASACDNPRTASAEPAAGTEAAAAAKPRPGDDFYTYVNGDWIASYELPPDKAWYGVSEELMEAAEADVRDIIEDLIAAGPAAGATGAKIADLYTSILDREAVEKRGIEPLKPHLDFIDAIRTRQDLIRVWATIGYVTPIEIGPSPHPEDPDSYAVWLSQSGLGMPHRGYYLETGADAEEFRTAYRDYVETIMSLLGYEDPAKVAADIFELERRIAEAHTLDDRSLPIERVYRVTNLAGLKRGAPDMDWEVFLSEVGFGDATAFVVTDGAAIRDCARLIDAFPLDTWKAWLAFHFADSFADSLPKAFDDASFDFHEGVLWGVFERPEAWRSAVRAVEGLLGDAIAELYAQRHFPPGHKPVVEGMVANLRAAFAARLRSLDWMDDRTRGEALAKLEAMQAMVGHPSRWEDFSRLEITRGRLFESIYSIMQFRLGQMHDDFSRPVDREEWPLTPQTVNAMYNVFGNRLYLPAAILKPPFFDPAADPAWNYGGIGAVIGHEISHGFDDRGRRFDGTGLRRNWWTPGTDAKFVKASGKLVAQFNGLCLSFGECVNGLGSLGENIGDLAGLQIAYDAYRASLDGKEPPVIDGLTGDQRFFVSYALSYREKAHEDIVRAELDADHPPAIYRVNGIVRNIDAWYDAFGVKPGDKLYIAPENRVRIW